MGNLHLVTGFAGKAHVAAADHASLFEAAIRSGQYVLSAGARFAASVVSNNQIRIADGELIMQGRHVKLDPGSYVDLAIENGAQGYLRNDMIVARYTCDAATGIEDCNLVVIKGIQAESDPADPAYSVGNINSDGAMLNDMPLYRVPLDGLNVGELQAFFVPQESLHDNTRPDSTLSQANKAADAAAVGVALAGKAPAGYGLGVNAKMLTSADHIDNITKNGYYAWSEVPQGFSSGGCVMHVVNMTESWLVQEITNLIDHPGTKLIRQRLNGVWQPPEWVNPPMVPGVEYRTTERHNGEVKYVKLVNCGIMPTADGKKQVTFLTDGDAKEIVRHSGYILTDWENTVFSLPYTLNGVNWCVQAISKNTIHLYASYDASAYTAYVTVWYTRQ